MKKNLIIPMVVLTSASLLASCTGRPTDIPPPPAEMGEKTENQTQEPLPPPANPIEPSVASGITTPATPSSSSFTRTEKVSYQSPAGLDEVEFTVMVEDSIIKPASSKTLATNPGSKMNQDAFSAAIGDKVIGKNIKDFDVDTIGGASLTTGAFEKFVQSL